MSEDREAVLSSIRNSLAQRGPQPPPAPVSVTPLPPEACLDLFVRSFLQNGGEAVRFASAVRARKWLEGFCQEFPAASVGAGVPIVLAPPIPAAPPEEAPLGVSLARLAVAETGSLLLDAREGRRVQLLPPCHLIWVREETVVGTLAEALARVKGDLPSVLAFHSGPSRSADIGQIMVRGVHGPGRVVVGIVP